MNVLDVWVHDDDTVKLSVDVGEDDEYVIIPHLRGDQVVRDRKDVYTADGITFDFNTKIASWDDDEGRPVKLIISPHQDDDLQKWFEKHTDRKNMEMVKPTLEEKLNPDVVSKIAEYGGKKKRKTRKPRKTLKSKRRTTRRRSSTRKV
jgi:hypothetical protein